MEFSIYFDGLGGFKFDCWRTEGFYRKIGYEGFLSLSRLCVHSRMLKLRPETQNMKWTVFR